MGRAPSPKELINYLAEEFDRFLTGVRKESSMGAIKQFEEDFFKDADEWFHKKKRFP